MVIPLVAVGQKITAGLVNKLIGGVNGIAMNGIVPTGVTGSGVTLSPGGAVTFTGASAATVIGCFSGSFANYRIVWNSPTQTANADLAMRLTNNGTDNIAANYSYTRGWDSGTGAARTVQMVTAASNWLLTAGATAGQTNDGYMDVFGPALNQYTSGLAQAVVHNANPNQYTTSTNLYNSTVAAFDGFTLFPLSGQITGTLRVYGYNDLI